MRKKVKYVKVRAELLWRVPFFKVRIGRFIFKRAGSSNRQRSPSVTTMAWNKNGVSIYVGFVRVDIYVDWQRTTRLWTVPLYGPTPWRRSFYEVLRHAVRALRNVTYTRIT